MKKAVFTHRRDIDGMGCAILAKLAFENPRITYHDYDDIFKEFKRFLEEENISEYDKIFILDLSISEHPDMVKLIEENEELKNKIVLLDHHDDSIPLNQYKWVHAEVVNLNLNEKTCAATMFLEYLTENKYLSHRCSLVSIQNLSIFAIQDFIEDVRKYDTWLWTTKYHEIRPKQLTDLFETYGIEHFVNHFKEQLEEGYYEFDEMDMLLINAKDREINNYIKSKEKNVIRKKLQGYECGIIFADMYRNDIAQYFKENHPDIEIVIIIGDSVSYRTDKDYIDLSKFAKIYGGGGSKQTAGSSISEEVRNTIIDLIIKEK